MKKLIVGLLILSGLAFGVASQANAVTELCPDGTGGFTSHISGSGQGDSFTYTAPAGKLVAELCVKAGTTTEYTTYGTPQPAVTVDHTQKDSVSHYSVRLVDEPPVTTTTFKPTTTTSSTTTTTTPVTIATVPTTTVVETTAPETTADETTTTSVSTTTTLPPPAPELPSTGGELGMVAIALAMLTGGGSLVWYARRTS